MGPFWDPRHASFCQYRAGGLTVRQCYTERCYVKHAAQTAPATFALARRAEFAFLHNITSSALL